MHGIYAIAGLSSFIPLSRRILFQHVFEVNAHEGDIAESYLDFGLFGLWYNHAFLGYIAAFLSIMPIRHPEKISWRLSYLLGLGIYAIIARYGVMATIVCGMAFPTIWLVLLRRHLRI